MLVELDAFSGRPNPRWRLSDSEAAELVRLIAGLAPAPGGSSPHLPGLGYRGFQLEGAAGAYRVYGELVQPASSVVLADPDRHARGFWSRTCRRRCTSFEPGSKRRSRGA